MAAMNFDLIDINCYEQLSDESEHNEPACYESVHEEFDSNLSKLGAVDNGTDDFAYMLELFKIACKHGIHPEEILYENMLGIKTINNSTTVAGTYV